VVVKMATLDIEALLTAEAKKRTLNMFATGKSFKVDLVRVGDGGYVLDDPTIAITPDETQTDVYGTPGGVYEGPIDSYDESNGCLVYTFTLGPGIATGPIGSFGLIATIVYSPDPGDPEVGVRFLFAIATRPLSVKVSSESDTYQIGIVTS
jgi:hypothetical protein